MTVTSMPTQVAIGDDGTMLAKYHKTHRYLAGRCRGDGYQQPGGEDPRWFDTSFGVRFGLGRSVAIEAGAPILSVSLV